MTRLSELPSGVFEGVIPAVLATCSADGVPNATWLSQVFYVDDQHVALSCQFFRKTRANLEARPVAELLVVDPASLRQWRLSIRFLRSETHGRTFESMRSKIQALASLTDSPHTFALRSSDVFEVLSLLPVDIALPDGAPTEERGAPNALRALAGLSEKVAASESLESLLDTTLSHLDTESGYESIGLYWFEESEDALYALASRGSARSGVGARIAFGVGVVGTCAQRRTSIRIADTRREVRYGQAVDESADGRSDQREREIPLPGLAEALSVLAVPLVARGRLYGVLEVESRRALAFDERDTQLLTIAGQLLVQGIVLHQEDDPERDLESEEARPTPPSDPIRVRYYDADDSVFVGGEYLIKGLPGRILWLILTLQKEEGRTTFLNRELRLHPFLKLPSYKDNLETRLLMLQRRLEDKSLPLRLSREQRGRLRIECSREIDLERIPS